MKIDKNTLVALFIEKNGEVVFKNREYFSEKDKVKKIVKLIYFKKSPNENVEVNIFLAVESWSLSKCISSNHPSRSSVMNEMIGDGFSFLQNENYIKSDGANWDTKWESIFTASTESYGWLIVNAKGDKAYKVYDLDSKVEEVVKW